MNEKSTKESESIVGHFAWCFVSVEIILYMHIICSCLTVELLRICSKSQYNGTRVKPEIAESFSYADLQAYIILYLQCSLLNNSM